MKNLDIRLSAAGHGIKLWKIADSLGISDCTFSRKLRKEISESEKQEIFAIIEGLTRRDENANHG